MNDARITKAELSRELKCSKGTITGLLARGLPVGPDGQLNRLEALEWISKHRHGKGGGWSGARHGGKQDLCSRAKLLLEAVPQTTGKPTRATHAKSRKPAPTPAATAVPTERDRTFTLGRRAGFAECASHLCGAAIRELPGLMVGMSFADLSPEEQALGARVVPLALTIYLLKSWAAEPLADAATAGLGPLPEIEWAQHFGIDAPAAREWFEDLARYWDDQQDPAA